MDRILSILKFNVRSLLPETSRTFQVVLAIVFLIYLLLFSHISGITNEHELIRNIGLVIAALIGFPMLIWRTSIADRQASTAEASHVAETYTKAIEQLGAVNDKGHPKLELRLGALYSLEKIALTNEDYHSQVMEVLCAYVRLNARFNSIEREDESIPAEAVFSPREDIQTVMTILGRRNIGFDQENARLNLRSVDLEGTDLSGAHLDKAIFEGSHLEHTKFINASLKHCSFERANLAYSDLSDCDAFHSNFTDANLKCAKLQNSKFQEVIFDRTNAQNLKARKADFRHATISDTNFSDAKLASSKFINSSAFTSQFLGTDINRADFSEAVLNNSVFRDVQAHRAKFSEAELYATAFEDMNFYGCDISAEDLFHSKLSNVGPEELINEVESLRKASAEAST